jgi:hypothetical protein
MSNDRGPEGELLGFAAAINSRLVAEARVARAMSFAWICAGAMISIALTGLGVAAAFVGYSHLNNLTDAADLISRSVADALQKTELKSVVTGKMALDPKSEIRLASDQTIRLSEGTTVKLDPSSSVRIIGNMKIDVPQPSKQQLQVDTTSQSEQLPFTEYTVFRDVDYGKGHVVTGWNYDLTDQLRPRSQICYYQESRAQGLSARYTLAVNNYPRRPSALTKVSFDFDGALANCIWFSGY